MSRRASRRVEPGARRLPIRAPAAHNGRAEHLDTVNARATAGLAWSLCGLTLLLLGLGLALWAANGFPFLVGTDAATGGAPIRLLAVMTFALVAVVGLLVARRQPTNPIGWIILAAVLVSVFDLFSQNFGAYTIVVSPVAARAVVALGPALNASAALVAIMLALFPNGRLLSARWRIVVWLAIAGGILSA